MANELLIANNDQLLEVPKTQKEKFIIIAYNFRTTWY